MTKKAKKQQPTAIDTPLGAREVADLLNVKRATVQQWMFRDVLPERDWTVGGQPAWATSTILEWALRTGRVRDEETAQAATG